MKTLNELEIIRKKTLSKIDIKEKCQGIRIVVGLATCGIAAGGRPVLAAFKKEIAKRKLSNVSVCQTGCIGACRLEPMAEVYSPGSDKVTYVKVDADMAKRIVIEHIVNGNPVIEYTIGYYEANNQ